MKHNILWIVLLLATSGQLLAQNNIQYTQFFFNKMAYNPAYAGSRETLTFGAQYRSQWAGVEGAPRTGTIYAHLPFLTNRNGAGLSINNDRIGKISTTTTQLSYAYHIEAGTDAKLGIGVSAQFEHRQIDWTRVQVLDVNDEDVPTAPQSYTRPNFGAGLFYSTSRLYLGLSVPQILKNALFFDNNEAFSPLRSYYLMGGTMLSLSDAVVFQPNVMLSYNPNAPFEADLNASFLFVDRLLVGATYRLGDSIDGVVQYRFSPQFKLGIAYDFTTSELNNYTSGSWEVWLEYSLTKQEEGLQHLRFF
ncbi:MAG: type IX secretion system membrane protein PorP/SprF [Bacteroidota bacterium]